jgi:hypothetical protein
VTDRSLSQSEPPYIRLYPHLEQAIDTIDEAAKAADAIKSPVPEPAFNGEHASTGAGGVPGGRAAVHPHGILYARTRRNSFTRHPLRAAEPRFTRSALSSEKVRNKTIFETNERHCHSNCVTLRTWRLSCNEETGFSL